MRQIISIAKKTEGHPKPIEAPEGGWTYAALSELAQGPYHVVLGKNLEPEDAPNPDEFPEQEIASGHTFALLARNAGAWEKTVASQARVIEGLEGLVKKLIERLGKQYEEKPQFDLAGLLAEYAPAIKKVLLSDGGGEKKKPAASE